MSRALACFLLAGAVPLAAAKIPQPVSPGATAQSAAVEARCPTFLWAGIPGARGYELAVFELSEADGAEPRLLTRASVPGDSRGFTPSSSDCLERGRRYAWSVAATAPAGQLQWSPPFLFEVDAAPSRDELEQAIATIERYREHRPGDASDTVAAAGRAAGGPPEPLTGDSPLEAVRTRDPRGLRALDGQLPGAPTSGATRVTSAATPSLGSPSLRVSANVALGAASNVFKYDAASTSDVVFLWDDTNGNTALGREALAMASGDATRNTAVGREALRKTTGGLFEYHGSYNTAVGDRALSENTTGFRNNANGTYALRSNTTGYQNTASGASALRSNTTGYNNTASGSFALHSNTSGFRNTASGNQALFANTTGSRNTASGERALYSNTSGVDNTASGNQALFANTASSNTASGSRALLSNTTGDYNTASGAKALQANTTGFRNTATGAKALYLNTTGFRNTACGALSLLFNTAGDYNTACGSQALYATTGDRNTALGDGAGFYATTGSDNIFVGSGAVGVAGEGHTIRIGGVMTGNGVSQQNRTFVNGIRGTTTPVADAVPVLIDSAGQLGTASSSRAVKQDIQDLGPIADRLLELRPVAFRYKEHAATDPDTPLQFGLVAEEVAEVFPELVVYDREGRPETVKYHLLSALLLGEVQRLHERLETIEDQDSARPKRGVERKHRLRSR